MGEDLFELGVAVDASPDIADDAAQIGLELAQGSWLAFLVLRSSQPGNKNDFREAADSRI